MTDIPFRVEQAGAPGDAPLEYEPARGGRVRLTVRLGERRTGGHSITVTAIRRTGSLLTVDCRIHAPERGAIVTQALTSPVATVSIDEALVRGVRDVVLRDAGGAELARVNA